MKANLTLYPLYWASQTRPVHTNLSTPLFASDLPSSVFEPLCLPSGDASVITRALQRGGDGAQVQLCPGAQFSLSEPIAFSAARQTLMTYGTPSDATRATLRVKSAANGTAIVADCASCEAPTASHLIIEGNALREPAQPPQRALVFFGENATGATLSHIDAKDAHARNFFEMSGNLVDCRGLKVTHNLFKTSARPLLATSGLNVRCAHSLVADNVFEGMSSVGLQLLDSPGSIVRDNLVQNAHSAMRFGIVVVLTPLSKLAGHPKGASIVRPLSALSALQLIKDNEVISSNEYLEGGIVVSFLGDSASQQGSPGSANVADGYVALDSNAITGNKMGHAIAISANFLVQAMNNRAVGQFSGVRHRLCGSTKPSIRLAFVSDDRQSKNSLQGDFTLGRFSPERCFVPSTAHTEL